MRYGWRGEVCLDPAVCHASPECKSASPGALRDQLPAARRLPPAYRPLGGGALTDTSGEEAAGGLSGRRSDAEARVDAVLADLVSRLEYRVERLSKHFQVEDGV